MSVQTTLAFIFTLLSSVLVVSLLILLGWFLIWKSFLSKFRLVRELLGQGDAEEQQHLDNNQADSHARVKKVRKD